jgi:hypothetical protein
LADFSTSGTTPRDPGDLGHQNGEGEVLTATLSAAALDIHHFGVFGSLQAKVRLLRYLTPPTQGLQYVCTIGGLSHPKTHHPQVAIVMAQAKN